MHDGMQYDPIQGQGQGHEPWKSKIRLFSKVSPPPLIMGAGKWPQILELGHRAQYLKLIGAVFFIFILVF